MAMRVMAAYFRGRLRPSSEPINFDSWTLDTYSYVHAAVKQGYQQVNWHVDVRADHANVIREVAAKGTVLLKNNGILPLNKPKFLAVIGEDAGSNPAGPNGCGDRGCDDGTLAMGWGSGTASFPYLITPDAALQAQAVSDGSIYQSIPVQLQARRHQGARHPGQRHRHRRSASTPTPARATSTSTATRATGRTSPPGRTAMTSSRACLRRNPNTIVVIHSTGPILAPRTTTRTTTSAPSSGPVSPARSPATRSSTSCYGKVNPSGRSPFTWGATRESYGTDLLYEPHNGKAAPQIDFSEGVFIDYRHFDKYDTPVLFEFGYGLSYTTFEYSNLQIQKSNAGQYTPTTGTTPAAPSFGNFSKDYKDYLFPSDQFPHVWQYIYPYLNTTDPEGRFGGSLLRPDRRQVHPGPLDRRIGPAPAPLLGQELARWKPQVVRHHVHHHRRYQEHRLHRRRRGASAARVPRRSR